MKKRFITAEQELLPVKCVTFYCCSGFYKSLLDGIMIELVPNLCCFCRFFYLSIYQFRKS